MNEQEISRIIEGVLFVSNEPVHIKGIAAAIDMTVVETNSIMETIIKKYEEDESRGIKIVRADDKFQLVTKQNIFGYLTKVNTSLFTPRIFSISNFVIGCL